MPETITQQEAALRCGLSHTAIRKWIKAGRLPARKFGRIVLVNTDDLEIVNQKSLQGAVRKGYDKVTSSPG